MPLTWTAPERRNRDGTPKLAGQDGSQLGGAALLHLVLLILWPFCQSNQVSDFSQES